MSAPDPNWLYASVVQSSAAIVAIVGGLVTSHVVDLLSRRRALAEQIEERRLALDAHRASVDDLRLDYVGIARIDEIIRWDQWPESSAIARKRLRGRYEGVDAVAQATFERWWSNLRGALVAIDQRIDAIGVDAGVDREFRDWLSDHNVAFPARVDAVDRSEEWLARKIFYKKVNHPETMTERDEAAQRILAGIQAEDAAIQTEQREISRLEDRRNEIGDPPRHLWFGFFALAFLSIGGIFVPLVFMPQPASSFRMMPDKVIVISLFSTGFALVFGYLFWLMRHRT